MQKLAELEKEVAAVTETNQRLMDELHSRSEQHDDNVSLLRTIHDLEEQIETLSRSERLAQQRIKQLEEEVRNLRNLEEVRMFITFFAVTLMRISCFVYEPVVVCSSL